MIPIMTTVLLAAIAVLGFTGCAGPKIPPGLGPMNADVSQMLEVYAHLTGKTLEYAQEEGGGAVAGFYPPSARIEGN